MYFVKNRKGALIYAFLFLILSIISLMITAYKTAFLNFIAFVYLIILSQTKSNNKDLHLHKKKNQEN